MIGLKVLVLAFLAIGSTQATVEYHEYPSQRLPVPDIVLKMIEQIKGLVDDLLVTVENIVDTALLEAEKIIKNLEGIIGSAYELALQKIDDLVEEAKQQNVDITDCVDGQKEAIENLKESSILGMDKCMSQGRENLNGVLEEVRAMVANIFVRVDDILREIKDPGCGILVCLPKLIARATALVSETVVYSGQIAIKATNMGGDIAKCVTSAGSNTSRQIADILRNVQKCYDDKVKPTPTSKIMY